MAVKAAVVQKVRMYRQRVWQEIKAHASETFRMTSSMIPYIFGMAVYGNRVEKYKCIEMRTTSV